MLIPTPRDARTHNAEEETPELLAVLQKIVEKIALNKGGDFWVDADMIPENLLPTVKKLLGRKGWRMESGYNEEERYSYISILPCDCCKHDG